MDFKLDLTTGDLDLTNGLSTVSGGSQRQQQLKLGLGINLGEWFADIDFGIPYINTGEDFTEETQVWLLSDSIPNKENYIKQVLDEFIESKDWVIALTSSYKFDRATRKYTYNYKVTTEEGEEFTDTIANSV